jgi:D-lactate dehydrogenase
LKSPLTSCGDQKESEQKTGHFSISKGAHMKVAIFSTHEFDRPYIETANQNQLDLKFIEEQLSTQNVALAIGCEAISCFTSDQLDAEILHMLKEIGVKLIALRSAGFNHLDRAAAKELGLTCVYVPSYSPYAIAEYAVGMLLSLNRKIHLAHQRTQKRSFNLDGLIGFDLHGKTIGAIGTGRIGKVFCRIMRGFGCEVLAYDLAPNLDWAKEMKVQYEPLKTVIKKCDVVSIHVPLSPETQYLINRESLALMKSSALLVNTSRGAIVNSVALLEALDSGKLGGACLDVYEYEKPIFFRPASEVGLKDTVLSRLLANERVLLTGHQAFLTTEALEKIASTTIESCRRFSQGLDIEDVRVPPHVM